MANIYTRTTKLKNASGRSDYISDITKQEEIVLNKSNQKHEWSFYDEYEKIHSQNGQLNNSAKEEVIALPNELYEDKEKLQTVCDDLATSILGHNRDYQYAVHWNNTRTNLHMHLIYSERERIDLSNAEPKIYKKDMWYDIETNKLAKANAPGAELRYKKGDIQRDKEGNIKYNEEPLTVKDEKFKHKSWKDLLNKQVQITLKKHGYELDIQDYNTPYLSQKKLYKGQNNDLKQITLEYNKTVREHNKQVKLAIKNDSSLEPVMKKIRSGIESDIKDLNQVKKGRVYEAIAIIKQATSYVVQIVKGIVSNIQEPQENKKTPLMEKLYKARGLTMPKKEPVTATKTPELEINKKIESLNEDIKDLEYKILQNEDFKYLIDYVQNSPDKALFNKYNSKIFGKDKFYNKHRNQIEKYKENLRRYNRLKDNIREEFFDFDKIDSLTVKFKNEIALKENKIMELKKNHRIENNPKSFKSILGKAQEKAIEHNSTLIKNPMNKTYSHDR